MSYCKIILINLFLLFLLNSNSECSENNIEGYYCRIEEKFCFNNSHIGCIRKNQIKSVEKGVSC